MLKSTDSISLMERLHANGWSKYEDELLLKAAEDARNNNKPLCKAFEETARMTGRKPNSIRNRYYALAKSNPTLLKRPADSVNHFSDAEQYALIRNMLIGIANGGSVRGCALRFGHGDMKQMLRYQNKYRTTLLKEPEKVFTVAEKLREEGYNIPDPYLSCCSSSKQKHSRISETLNLLSSLSENELEQLISTLSNFEKCRNKDHAQRDLL